MDDISDTEEEPSDDQNEVLDDRQEGPDEEEGEDALNDLEHGYIIPEIQRMSRAFVAFFQNSLSSQ